MNAADPIELRDGRDDDGPALKQLLEICFDEYPECVLDVDREAPELRSIATAYARDGGRFWVVERHGEPVGCVGARPTDDGGLELRKLYVDPRLRRVGLGRRLCAVVEDEARCRGVSFVELWSDTRFLDAHRLYRAVGYRRGREVRCLHDLSGSYERYFRLPLDPEGERAPSSKKNRRSPNAG